MTTLHAKSKARFFLLVGLQEFFFRLRVQGRKKKKKSSENDQLTGIFRAFFFFFFNRDLQQSVLNL